MNDNTTDNFTDNVADNEKPKQKRFSVDRLQIRVTHASEMKPNPDNPATEMSLLTRYEGMLHELALLVRKYRKHLLKEVARSEETRKRRTKR